MVFAGLYPTDNAQYEDLRDALEKLQLNDSSFFYEPDTSGRLGFGFRCGFLGLLHMEIVQERLEREFNLSLITTAPGVRYRITTRQGEVFEIHNPSKLPPAGRHREVRRTDDHGHDHRPTMSMSGPILKLAEEKRGVQKGFEYVIRQPGADHLRAAAQRDRPRLLRPPEIRLPRLRFAGLSLLRIQGSPSWSSWTSW